MWASFLHLPGQLVGQLAHTVPGRQVLDQHLIARDTGVALTWISAAQAARAAYQIQSNLLTWQICWDQLFGPICQDKFRNPFLFGTLNAVLFYKRKKKRKKSSFLYSKRPLQRAHSCVWASLSVWLGKNLHVNWWEYPCVLPKVARHVQQLSSSCLHVPLPPCRWWLAEGVSSLVTPPPFPQENCRGKGLFLCRCIVAIGFSSMHVACM